jgi:hypothetical protein
MRKHHFLPPSTALMEQHSRLSAAAESHRSVVQKYDQLKRAYCRATGSAPAPPSTPDAARRALPVSSTFQTPGSNPAPHVYSTPRSATRVHHSTPVRNVRQLQSPRVGSHGTFTGMPQDTFAAAGAVGGSKRGRSGPLRQASAGGNPRLPTAMFRARPQSSTPFCGGGFGPSFL